MNKNVKINPFDFPGVVEPNFNHSAMFGSGVTNSPSSDAEIIITKEENENNHT